MTEMDRETLIEEQPIFWARQMLNAADKTDMEDARDAIFTRLATELLLRFGLVVDLNAIHKLNVERKRRKMIASISWKPILDEAEAEA